MQRFITLLALLLLLPAGAQSQWQNIAPNALGDMFTGVVQPDRYGAVSFSGGKLWAGKSALWVSSDTGMTWTKKLTLTGGNLIMDISFLDANHGLVSTLTGFVMLTNDGGQTWQNIPGGTQAGTAFYMGSPDHIVICGEASGILVSHDGGISWTQSYGGANRILAYGKWVQDSVAYALALEFTSYSKILLTTDFGDTWTPMAGAADWDSYGFDFDKCDPSIIYLANEDARTSSDNLSNIFVSNDSGKSWSNNLSRPVNTFTSECYVNGAIVNTGKATYAQTRADGILRSADRGLTWASIGGPGSGFDSRLFTAVNDNVIIAVDSNGSVWRSLIPAPNSSFVFSSGRVIDPTPGATMRLPIYYRFSGSPVTVDMVMHYQHGPLQYQGSFLVSGKSLDVPGDAWNGRAKLHFDVDDLTALSAFDSLIGHAVFKWYPLEFYCTYVNFDSIASSLGPSPCGEVPGSLSSGKPFSGIIGSYEWCGKASVGGEQQTNPLFSFTPNPARESATVVSSVYTGEVDLELFNIDGRLIESHQDYISPQSSIRLDLTSLATGPYYISIRAGSAPAYMIAFMHYGQ